MFASSNIFIIIILLISSIFISSSTATTTTIIHHQPLFPAASVPPPVITQPALSPPPSKFHYHKPKQNKTSTPTPKQSKPKYPLTSQSPPPSKHNDSIFFPTYSPPPSPPPSSLSSPSSSNTKTLPTFPANVTNINDLPNSSPSKPISHKLATIAITVSILSVTFILLLAAFYLYYHHHPRQHQHIHPNPSKPGSFHILNIDTSNKLPPLQHPPPPPPPPQPPRILSSNSAEILRLTNLADHNNSLSIVAGSSSVLSYQKLGSPELRPLPPLPRLTYRRDSTVGFLEQEDEDDDNTEFYSPKRNLSEIDFPPPAMLVVKSPSSSPSPTSSPVNISWDTHNSPKDSKFIYNQHYEPEIVLPPPPPSPPPPPPPMPPMDYWESVILASPATPSEDRVMPNVIENLEEIHKPKLKALHWDKVKASSNRTMVWDRMKSSSSFELNEEMMETLFTKNSSTSSTPKDFSNWPMNNENRLLDPKKSRNIAILLRALNVTIDEVCEGLLEGNIENLGTELLESLLKMAPTKEEENKLIEFNETSSPFKLGPAEKFLKALLEVPFAFKRVDALLYIANFDSEVEYLERSFETLEAACDELRNSKMFLKLLEAVLKTGNRMNVGTNRGDAQAFKLDTLLKLADIKGIDGKTSLLHFVVQEIIRTEGHSRLSDPTQYSTSESEIHHHYHPQSELHEDIEFRKIGLQVVSSLSGELSNVKKTAAMDSDMLYSEVGKLATGITKIGEVFRLNEEIEPITGNSIKFRDSMNGFLKKAKNSIIKIQAQESEALSMVKDITEYFHGNSVKEEAHPFRIFKVVGEFLSVLDQVCRDIGKINERISVHSARPLGQSIPSVFPQF